MAKGLLFASFDFSTAHADEFHDWYDLEHVPERLRVPGILNAERWIGADNPTLSIATYDLETLGVLRSPPYVAVAGANGSPWTMREWHATHGNSMPRGRPVRWPLWSKSMVCSNFTGPASARPSWQPDLRQALSETSARGVYV